LELGLSCEQYKSLPLSGGVLDQPAGLMRKMRMVLNVFHAFKAYNRDGQKPGEMAKWRNENQDTWAIVSEIKELRDKHG
jgi:hypothetical protein